MSTTYQPTMEEDLANLNIEDEEEESVMEQLDKDIGEDDFSFCLMGRVLTNEAVNSPSWRNILAEIWHRIEGVMITELDDKRILLMNWISGGWSMVPFCFLIDI